MISITAYRENEADWNMDSSGTPVSPLPPLFNQINDDIFDLTDQFTQEFRWVSSIGDNIDYVAGLWYLGEETDRTECFDNDVTDERLHAHRGQRRHRLVPGRSTAPPAMPLSVSSTGLSPMLGN